MLVARFSDNIEADITRGWSAWMTPGLGGTIEDCQQDIEDGIISGGEIVEFPEHPGCYGIKHHEGLSCYLLDSETLEDAISEVKASRQMNGDGYGMATVGQIKLIASVDIGELRMLHILEVEDVEPEI